MKKVIRFLVNTVACFLIIFILATALLYVVGIKPTIITSGSMEPAIDVGDICFINTRYPFEKIKSYDIIVYRDPRQKVIHRVIGVTAEGLVTKGDANNNADRMKITQESYYGKFVFLVPKLGFITTKLQNPAAKTLFVVLMIGVLMIAYFLNTGKAERKK